ncbi:hypothetical protein [Pseudomonas sp. CGJS7]|uniref:hypothetical protein n=1 Tax=Pseudomonas sp. CGJS7 TaxID=3109348 RepID=UPI003009450F
MLRLFISIIITLLLSAPVCAQNPVVKSVAKAPSKSVSETTPVPSAPPGQKSPTERAQDILYRRSPAVARLADSSESSLEFQEPRPLMRWEKNTNTNLGLNDSYRRERCAYSIKKMRDASVDEKSRREVQARNECRGVSFGD